MPNTQAENGLSTRRWPSQRRVEYFWMIMGKCNYRCPYCVYGIDPSYDRRKDERVYTAEEWLSRWRRMHALYGEGNIILTGGEPTFYPGFAELATELTSLFWLAFDTNLSWEKPQLEKFLSGVKTDRVRLETSFHPHMTETAAFIDKLTLVRDRGFGYIARLVAYPDMLPRLPEFRGAFARAGLDFVVNPFQGQYQGKAYPAAYSEKDRAAIAGSTVGLDRPDNSTHKEFVEQILARESPKGRLCRSGYQHVRIEDDGQVYRCGEYSTKKWEPMGHFFDDELKLWDEPKLCRADFCEWEYRWLVDQAERFKNG